MLDMWTDVVAHRVGFFAATSLPSILCVTNPYSHWSLTTVCALGKERRCLTHGSSHDMALCGCSKRECRPCLTCSLQRLTTTRRCRLPSASSCSTRAGTMFGKFRFTLSFEKDVRGGEPISQAGLLFNMSCLARRRSRARPKPRESRPLCTLASRVH